MRPLTGIVIAGGKGTRLGGRDKAFLEIHGEPIIIRTLRLFRSLFAQTIVVTLDPGRFADLGVDVTADRYPGGGPLAGIHAGLLATRTPYAFVAACDMPLLETDVIRFLIGRIGPDSEAPPDVVVPWWDGDVEPLHAVYARRCIAPMERCLNGGTHAIRDFLQHVRVDYVPEQVVAQLAGAARSFTNVNTPSELERLTREWPDDPAQGSVAANTPPHPRAGQ
jgi:molybdopterin-guanine dinucleotide biosynthesis protein A